MKNLNIYTYTLINSVYISEKRASELWPEISNNSILFQYSSLYMSLLYVTFHILHIILLIF